MRRLPHIISRPKRNSIPKEVIFFDTETRDIIQDEKSKKLTLKIGYAQHVSIHPKGHFVDREDLTFTTSDEFNAWLEQTCLHKKTYWIVAHNIGFDIRITHTIEYLVKHNWTRKTFIEDGINFICTFTRSGTNLKFVNNQQYFNCSLKYLGQSIGVEKINIDFTYTTDTALIEYCMRDVWIMREAWRIWIDFIRQNNLGSFKLTAASQSMEAFRHSFMHQNIYIHNNDKVTALERASYHGGRVECMYIGECRDGPIYNLDVNSMYPSQMLKPVPYKLIKYYNHANLRIFEKYKKDFGYIVEATFDLALPCLAVRSPGGKLVFPVGRVSGSFTKPEIEAGILCGRLLEVHKIALYDEAPIFTDFVGILYNARQKFKAEGNQAFGYIAKLLMNSLYGKFAQRKTEYKVVGKTTQIPDGVYNIKWPSPPWYAKMRVLGGVVEQETKAEEGYNSFTAISSYITGYARVYLNRIILSAGRDNCLYCDTDSIFVNERGFKRIKEYLDNTALGKLKVVGIEPNMTIWAPKRYRFGDKLVQKGIRANATSISEGTFEQDKFMSFHGGLRAGDLQDVLVTRIIKRCLQHYDKGIILPSGRVEPLVFQ